MHGFGCAFTYADRAYDSCCACSDVSGLRKLLLALRFANFVYDDGSVSGVAL